MHATMLATGEPDRQVAQGHVREYMPKVGKFAGDESLILRVLYHLATFRALRHRRHESRSHP